MQNSNWDHYRIALTVYRTGTYLGAALRLNVDDTTIARRVRSLERDLGETLFHRTPSDKLQPTPAGLRIIHQAERMEDAVTSAHPDIAPTARITAVSLLANHVLIPNLPDMFANNPNLTLDLVPDARNLSLTRRDADLALRLARPQTGGSRVIAQRLATLPYGVFSSRDLSLEQAETLPWITYDESMAHLPSARWINQQTTVTQDPARLRVSDASSALHAIQAGLGKSVLPLCIDATLANIRALPRPDIPLHRELWLLSHRDTRDQPHLAALRTWLASLPWTGNTHA